MRLKAGFVIALFALGITAGTQAVLAQGVTVCVKAHLVVDGQAVVNEDRCETVEAPAP